MRRVLTLKHAWECPEAFVGSILDEYAIAYDSIEVEHERLPDLSEYGAVISLGGPQHVYAKDQAPYLLEEEALIRKAVEREVPFLGICLGGQLLAGALGASVKQHQLTEVGFFDVEITKSGQSDALFAGFVGPQKVFHWHQDTFDLPEGAQLLATSANTTNQAFRVGRRAYGLQYHIELDEEMLNTWLYHPECKESMLHSIDMEGYRAIEADRKQFFNTYQAHSRLLFSNFLKISELISPEQEIESTCGTT